MESLFSVETPSSQVCQIGVKTNQLRCGDLKPVDRTSTEMETRMHPFYYCYIKIFLNFITGENIAMFNYENITYLSIFSPRTLTGLRRNQMCSCL